MKPSTQPAWTIRSLLAWMTQDFQAAGIATPRLDAEILIAFALGCDRVRVYLDLDRPLTPEELVAVRALVVRRRKREPVAYIVGQREFYQRAFSVSPAVLIPRPDTETLIERALELMPEDKPVHVLDLCTGSGAIAVTLAAERPLAEVHATDLSDAALSVARDNAERHGVAERIRFAQGDLFGALPERVLYDLIVANPPYIRAGDAPSLAPEIRLHEPELALFAGEDGLAIIERLCVEVGGWLASGGTLLFEIGAGQAEGVMARMATLFELTGVRAHRDLGGVLRVIEARRA